MEKIDLNNYEAYFLDYMEGTLSAEEKHDLFAFLKLHPELKAEMEEDFGELELLPEHVVYAEKETLKIDEHELVLTKNTVDDLIIASVEGQLNESQNKQLMAFIKEEKLEKTLAYYKATILQPDLNEVYADKEKLKAKTGLVISMRTVTRVTSVAAAAVLLFILSDNWLNQPETVSDSNNKGGAFAAELNKGNQVDHDTKEMPAVNEYSVAVDQVPTNLAENGSSTDTEQEAIELNNDLFAHSDDQIEKIDSLPENEKKEEPIVPLIDDEDLNDEEIVRKEEKEKDRPMILPDSDDSTTEDDVAVADNKNRTEEPYKLFTDAASNVVNRDISFKREKDIQSDDYVAYSFRLGSFEFERKKSK